MNEGTELRIGHLLWSLPLFDEIGRAFGKVEALLRERLKRLTTARELPHPAVLEDPSSR